MPPPPLWWRGVSVVHAVGDRQERLSHCLSAPEGDHHGPSVEPRSPGPPCGGSGSRPGKSAPDPRDCPGPEGPSGSEPRIDCRGQAGSRGFSRARIKPRIKGEKRHRDPRPPRRYRDGNDRRGRLDDPRPSAGSRRLDRHDPKGPPQWRDARGSRKEGGRGRDPQRRSDDQERTRGRPQGPRRGMEAVP